jgi:flagellar biogenesis protein FliO
MKTWLIWAALAAVLVLVAAKARAQPTQPAAKDAILSGPIKYTPHVFPERPAIGAMLLRLGLATAFVLALCGATMLLAYRRARHLPAKAGGGKLKLVESFPLGGGSSLHLIQRAGQKFVVAVNRSGLHSLVPLSESFAETFETVRANPLETPHRPATTRSRLA